MLQISKFTKLFIIVAIIISSATFAQDKPMHMQGMKTEKQSVDSSLIRKGVIDLKSIDKNNDGKVYQCPMEANVLSDTKSECPECGMNLREVSIADASTKLLKRGFEVKEPSMKDDSKSTSKNDESKVAIWNKLCPVMGEEVDPEAPTQMFKGKIIGFCCKGCEKKFEKDPEKYLKNLNEDGTKFIGKK